ncbi:MAG: ribose ABC transporter substrate-binding protein RbsB [Kyrpidia sp.]|nr:ribose ABC transporter substrate-binding protein RbsB [Kyrpidia sp.]
MKKWMTLTASFCLTAAVLAGCGAESQPNEGTQPNGEKQLTIGLALSTLNNPFFVDMRDGAQAEADQIHAKLIVTDAQDDSSKQVSQVEDLIQQKVDVILLNPADSAALVPAVQEANKNHIPVITLDRTVDGGQAVSHIASDNIAGGMMAGQFIVDQLKGKGKVVELEGIPGTSAARERGQGFHKVIDQHPEIRIVAKQPADFNRDKGMSVMENILQAQPDIQAVFAHNDEMALGALQAIAASKRANILVVGFDGGADAVKAVKEGRMAATVAQQPKLIGKLGVDTAQKVAQKQSVDAKIPVELKLITKD